MALKSDGRYVVQSNIDGDLLNVILSPNDSIRPELPRSVLLQHANFSLTYTTM